MTSFDPLPQQSVAEPQIPSDSAVSVISPKKSHGVFELKFLVDEDQAQSVMAWARQQLDPDPHSDTEFGDGYLVNSLYLDTPNLDVFHRSEGFRQQKFRLRRYGQEMVVWLEQKKKRKGLVRKKRVSVIESEIALRLGETADAEWDGSWFRRKIEDRLLRPVCQVTYHRFARIKNTNDGMIRLTMDDRLAARAANGWDVPHGTIEGLPLLDGKRILELKFRGAIPGMFRQLIDHHRLEIASFSKYRTSIESCVQMNSVPRVDGQGRENA